MSFNKVCSKDVLKKIGCLFLCSVLCFVGVLVTNVSTVYAYDEETCYVDEEGNWQVLNADGPTVTVSMYMMMQPKYTTNSGFRTFYSFWCSEGDFNYLNGRHTTADNMVYFFRSENAQVVDIYDDYEIWYWSFNIEPGIYRFAEPEGLNNISVLTQSLGSPFVRDGYNESIVEKTVVQDGDHIRLYCMLGDWEWRKQEEQLYTLQEYATMKEEKLGYGKVEDHEEKTETTIEVENVQTEEILEPTAEPLVEEVQEAVPSASPFVDATMEANVDSEEKSSAVSVVNVILVIVFLGGVLFVTRKKKDE